jgi:hypothetical protein
MVKKPLTKFTAWNQLTYIWKERKLTMTETYSEVNSSSETSGHFRFEWRYEPEDRMLTVTADRDQNKKKYFEVVLIYRLILSPIYETVLEWFRSMIVTIVPYFRALF